MPNTVKKLTLYDDLLALPGHMVGEIIDGLLRIQPRPAGKHTLAHSELIVELGGPFDRGRAAIRHHSPPFRSCWPCRWAGPPN
ncbi:MAG: hypothetical protein IPM89_12695 [Candidatus Competibacteraceae bacterium]|nr:MAG: hypothetical protein IPM89_12695 [Candidatus Competibacteraceae bacterium]